MAMGPTKSAKSDSDGRTSARAEPPKAGSTYRVQPGDTMSAISLKALGSAKYWKVLAALNAEGGSIGPEAKLRAYSSVLTIPTLAVAKATYEALMKAPNGWKPPDLGTHPLRPPPEPEWPTAHTTPTAEKVAEFLGVVHHAAAHPVEGAALTTLAIAEAVYDHADNPAGHFVGRLAQLGVEFGAGVSSTLQDIGHAGKIAYRDVWSRPGEVAGELAEAAKHATGQDMVDALKAPYVGLPDSIRKLHARAVAGTVAHAEAVRDGDANLRAEKAADAAAVALVVVKSGQELMKRGVKAFVEPDAPKRAPPPPPPLPKAPAPSDGPANVLQPGGVPIPPNPPVPLTGTEAAAPPNVVRSPGRQRKADKVTATAQVAKANVREVLAYALRSAERGVDALEFMHKFPQGEPGVRAFLKATQSVARGLPRAERLKLEKARDVVGKALEAWTTQEPAAFATADHAFQDALRSAFRPKPRVPPPPRVAAPLTESAAAQVEASHTVLDAARWIATEAPRGRRWASREFLAELGTPEHIAKLLAKLGKVEKGVFSMEQMVAVRQAKAILTQALKVLKASGPKIGTESESFKRLLVKLLGLDGP